MMLNEPGPAAATSIPYLRVCEPVTKTLTAIGGLGFVGLFGPLFGLSTLLPGTKSMRRQLMSLLVLTFSMAAFSPATAADGDFAYVRSDAILANFGMAKSVRAQLQQEIEAWRKEAGEMEQELATMQRDYQSQSAMLSGDARAQKEESISRKRVALEEYVQRYFGQDGKAEKRQQELLGPVETSILAAIKSVAESQKIKMVFDASRAGFVWAQAELEITDQVIEELNP